MTATRGAAERAASVLTLSPDDCYRAMVARDRRFDGVFWVGVTSTGIYCRPSCPTPVQARRDNATFHATPAAAHGAGFRACKRCRPDATPGSPLWDVRSDLVGRAMRLIADGVVEREGVAGLAARLAVSTRHLDRLLAETVGAGPLAIARSHRANTARVLIETSTLPFGDIAFAAGFSSVRQFNDTIRAVFDRTPTQLRSRSPQPSPSRPMAVPDRSMVASGVGPLALRLALRPPIDAGSLRGWFVTHPVPGVQVVHDGRIARTLRLPGGGGVALLDICDDHVACRLWLDDLADLGAATERCRRLLDLDADPEAIFADLTADRSLGTIAASRVGMRAPGSVDGFETAVLALAGQQVSVLSACATVARFARRFGTRLEVASHGGDIDAVPGFEPIVFPAPEAIVDADLTGVGFTERTSSAVRRVAELVVGGLSLDPGSDRRAVRAGLLAIRGVGPWTADYVTMRALRDPDVLPVGDLVVRRGAAVLGLPDTARDLAAAGEAWSPWRTYATHLLWAAAGAAGTNRTNQADERTTR